MTGAGVVTFIGVLYTVVGYELGAARTATDIIAIIPFISLATLTKET